MAARRLPGSAARVAMLAGWSVRLASARRNLPTGKRGSAAGGAAAVVILRKVHCELGRDKEACEPRGRIQGGVAWWARVDRARTGIRQDGGSVCRYGACDDGDDDATRQTPRRR